jgi:hypothetical protein
VDLDDGRNPKFWHKGHLTRIAVSYLIDDAITGEITVVMRDHIKKCDPCRGLLLTLLKIDNKFHPQG